MNYTYNTTCSLVNLKGIRTFIKRSLQQQGIPDVFVNTLVLALDEVCSNIMIHGHHCHPNHFIEISIQCPDTYLLVFEIIDEGNTFDINGFPVTQLTSLVRERRKGGLGIKLVRSIMDKIEYEVRDRKTVCRLIKQIPSLEGIP